MKLWHKLGATVVLSGLAAVVTPQFAAAQSVIKIDGSSTVFPIAEAVAEEFQIAKRGKVRVTVGIAGTGGGFKRFCRGETDISNASRPILKEEMEACRAAGIKYLELPVAFDALTVVVNPKNDWVKSLTVADLRKMWEPGAQGRVKTWNQIRSEWPAQPLMLFGPGADSGTFDYFTEVINGKVDEATQNATQSEDDNVLVTGVAGDVNAISFFGYAYFVENTDKLKALEVDAGSGCVAPTEATINDNSYKPLSRPLFIYPDVKKAKARPELKAFVDFYLANTNALSAEVGYVALPADVLKKSTDAWAAAVGS
jgi:phosphate transport system substrate-binding protein